MVLPIAVLLTLGTLVFTLMVRAKDVPEVEPVSPTQHLDERKAQIYDNLRDLQFEYRLGKLSDDDYQKTKRDLQGELARVMAETDAIKEQQPPVIRPAKTALKSVPKMETEGTKCPHCAATFDRPLKFCGECGKAMA